MNKFEAVLHLGDLHIGEKINLPDNTFSINLAKARLGTIADKAIFWLHNVYGRTNPIERLHIFDVGDNIHNELMRGSAKMSAETDFTEQIEAAAEMLGDIILRIVQSTKSLKYVHIYGIKGNHGRVGKPGEESPNANFDRQVYKHLSLYLRLKLEGSNLLKQRSVQFHFDFPKEAYGVAPVNGYWFVYEHGNVAKSQLGIPYYGTSRQRDRRYKQLRGKMHYYLLGHYHREYSENDGAVEVLMTPSLPGMNEHAQTLGFDKLAGAMLYIVDTFDAMVAKHPLKVHTIQEES